MGKDEATMLRKMREAAEPLFKRQIAINQALGQPGRFKGSIRDLSPVEILLLLYCEDRDVANTARIEIETHTRTHLYSQALISILRDRRHPQRRIAQWCVLDLFEDLGSYAITKDETDDALAAMKGLLLDAEDDFARAVFKAGTVIGGHLQSAEATRALLECLASPSRIGRRSAIHGLFHVVEWHPQVRAEIVAALRAHASEEKDSQLKDFSERMADDIETSAYDHIPEPIFHDEP
jgi:hypothetical protein